jgi:hypothetical protein
LAPNSLQTKLWPFLFCFPPKSFLSCVVVKEKNYMYFALSHCAPLIIFILN